MPDKPKFHLDESVTAKIAKGLRARNRDCSTTPEQGLIAASDLEQVAFAKSEGRVLITADDDFLAIAAADADHPGIIFCRSTTHFGRVVVAIDEMCVSMTADDFRSRVIYL
ncbi:DUF5615 family PIN-like protein [Botrimarina sp.]|uniref:DUF5615 family PIN-like protein n=1 Tax=Botrimarina sp. TaxID=2795802 RepID=UPI0032EE35FC